MRREGGALVVAVGNPLRGDDGAGPAAAAGLEGPGVRVLAVQQLGPELADEVAAARAVVFLDARAGGAPGAVRVVRLAPAGGSVPLAHALAPEVVLALAERLHGARPPAALVTVSGADFALAERLTPEVERALPALRAAARAFLESTSRPDWSRSPDP